MHREVEELLGIRDLNDDEKAAVKETFENLDRVIAEVLG
jgi:hypothetical protein